MEVSKIKERFPRLSTDWETSPFIVNVISNPEGYEVCGSYKEYGGDPTKFIYEGNKCPSCGEFNSAVPSDIIGYLNCGRCSENNPATNWYNDTDVARKVFNMSVSEVMSNNDNIARLEELGEEYNRMYWELTVTHEPIENNVPSFFFYSSNFRMFRFYAGKNEPDLHSKIVECIATQNLTMEVYAAFMRFLRCDPTIMRIDRKKTLVVTATPKHDLLERMRKYYNELKQYRKLMDDYMIDFTVDEIDEDILEEDD